MQLSVSYQQYFLQPMLRSITDKQPEVRQAAAYGIGVMAQFGGVGYAPMCAGSIICVILILILVSVN